MDKYSNSISINGMKLQLLEQHKTNPKYKTKKRQVFIIGSKGIPAAYGGFETFVEKLTEYQVSDKIRYHVSCIGDSSIRYEYNGAKCFTVNAPNIGAAKAIYYDIAALNTCIKYCKERSSIKSPIFYVLACRIGPFIGHYKKEIKKLGGFLIVNPDGHEWKRAKWSAPIRKYWKLSEGLMVKHSDLLICDSINIEKYIQKDYKQHNTKTTFIPYGADTKLSKIADDSIIYNSWLREKGLFPKCYYLVVGRFVPENNFETIIHEFMKSKTNKKLAIISTINIKFQNELESKLHYRMDERVRFVGTVYNQELLKKIRENAYGYIHGHEVGGTNPSLLEALGSTDFNLLLDVGFNREVGAGSAFYWKKLDGNLAALIDRVDQMTAEERAELGRKAKKRITDAYSWEHIVEEYEKIFLKGIN